MKMAPIPVVPTGGVGGATFPYRRPRADCDGGDGCQPSKPEHVGHAVEAGLACRGPRARPSPRRARRSCGPPPGGRARPARRGRRAPPCGRRPPCRRGASRSRSRLPAAGRHGRRGRGSPGSASSTPRPCGHRLAQHQRGAGGRVDLGAVVHLDDLDVPVRPERPRRLPGEAGEQVDAEAHIAGADDDRVPRRRVEPLRAAPSCRPVVPITWTMRACAASSESATVASGVVKSSAPSAAATSGSGSSVTSTPSRPDAGEFARVLAERVRALGARRRRTSSAPVRLVDRAHQRAPHPPGRSGDDQAHRLHGASSVGAPSRARFDRTAHARPQALSSSKMNMALRSSRRTILARSTPRARLSAAFCRHSALPRTTTFGPRMIMV